MDELSAFGELGARLGFLLHYADVAAMAGLYERLADLDMTPVRATAVVYVGLHEGCDQMALGRALGVNRARAMKVVDELEARGAVERRSGRDRRSNALHLTPAGAALRVRIEDATLKHDEVFFGALTVKERDDLRALLAKLRDAAPDVVERDLATTL
ncbi:MarR family winged helix-turn-helix transcriptional regulator [Caulobacter sp. RL271]|uniref:MarR family winged helix-turn-helix transcriptional regulator n=1 Tax=Caulobacter segnis TaxID=88688 RepID=A0ABY4ZZI1_9CAUL|nr:MarR family winged helix-turn-helix transcriptional regulator [Caulobacter segnis]USQ98228.1 MarR family winged helix-turn-helix transcriptional regulator [Caulobacter segnis]